MMKHETPDKSSLTPIQTHLFSVFITILLVFILIHPVQTYSLAKAAVNEIRSCVMNIITIKDQIVSISPADLYPAF